MKCSYLTTKRSDKSIVRCDKNAYYTVGEEVVCSVHAGYLEKRAKYNCKRVHISLSNSAIKDITPPKIVITQKEATSSSSSDNSLSESECNPDLTRKQLSILDKIAEDTKEKNVHTVTPVRDTKTPIDSSAGVSLGTPEASGTTLPVKEKMLVTGGDLIYRGVLQISCALEEQASHFVDITGTVADLHETEEFRPLVEEVLRDLMPSLSEIENTSALTKLLMLVSVTSMARMFRNMNGPAPITPTQQAQEQQTKIEQSTQPTKEPEDNNELKFAPVFLQ